MPAPYIEILTPPNVTISNVHCTYTDDIRITPMPIAEMCLEDMPAIHANLEETLDP
jgi:hypothetical protein